MLQRARTRSRPWGILIPVVCKAWSRARAGTISATLPRPGLAPRGIEGWLPEECQEAGTGGSKEIAKAHSRGHMGPKCTYFWCLVWLYSGPEQR